MKIGELSKVTGVSVPTIRLYEREGLIEPARRTEGHLRVFTEAQKRRLDFIKRVRNLGFSLDEVRALLSCSSGEECATELLRQIRLGIAERKRDLEKLESSIAKVSDQKTVLEIEDAFWETSGL